jgi:hypothetical protein
MSISKSQRLQVRERADFACEYCGVTETDTGGMLTIDYFQPSAKGGSDSADNLIYCCHRCNEYKSDYWPQEPGACNLWNPRQEAATAHFVEAEDGSLIAWSETGRFTLSCLRLNRPPLIANRLRRRQKQAEARLLTRLRDVTNILTQLQIQHQILAEENHLLLLEQRRLLELLVKQADP